MANGRGRRKPERPTPYRASSLWRGCLWAIAAGWNRGWNEPGGQTTYDDQRLTRGILQGSRPGTHVIIDAGRALASGISDDRIDWSDIANGYNGINGQVSVAVLFRVTTVPNSNRRIICKRFSGGNAEPGWDLFTDFTLGNVISFEFSDGVDEDRVSTTTAAAADTTQTFLCVATHDRTRAAIWLNGIREAVNAAPARIPANNNQPIDLFSNPNNDTRLDGDIAMAAVWNRALSDGEILQLNTDPYTMWRPRRRLEFLAFSPPAPSVADNDCCCPCCGGFNMNHMGLG